MTKISLNLNEDGGRKILSRESVWVAGFMLVHKFVDVHTNMSLFMCSTVCLPVYLAVFI